MYWIGATRLEDGSRSILMSAESRLRSFCLAVNVSVVELVRITDEQICLQDQSYFFRACRTKWAGKTLVLAWIEQQLYLISAYLLRLLMWELDYHQLQELAATSGIPAIRGLRESTILYRLGEVFRRAEPQVIDAIWSLLFFAQKHKALGDGDSLLLLLTTRQATTRDYLSLVLILL